MKNLKTEQNILNNSIKSNLKKLNSNETVIKLKGLNSEIKQLIHQNKSFLLRWIKYDEKYDSILFFKDKIAFFNLENNRSGINTNSYGISLSHANPKLYPLLMKFEQLEHSDRLKDSRSIVSNKLKEQEIKLF